MIFKESFRVIDSWKNRKIYSRKHDNETQKKKKKKKRKKEEGTSYEFNLLPVFFLIENIFFNFKFIILNGIEF